MMLRRTNPELRFSDLVVPVDEIDLDNDEDEKAELRQHITADPSRPMRRKPKRWPRSVTTPEPVEPGKDEPDDSPTDSPSPPPD